jgi:phosphopantetheine adenylyltransferase
MADNVDNALMLEILKDVRKEQRDQRVLLLQLAEHNRRLEQRMETQFLAVNQRLNHLKDELLGALTNFQNKIELYVDQRLAEKAE